MRYAILLTSIASLTTLAPALPLLNQRAPNDDVPSFSLRFSPRRLIPKLPAVGMGTLIEDKKVELLDITEDVLGFPEGAEDGLLHLD